MNKLMTFFMLVVIVCAMGLIYSATGEPPIDVTAWTGNAFSPGEPSDAPLEGGGGQEPSQGNRTSVAEGTQPRIEPTPVRRPIEKNTQAQAAPTGAGASQPGQASSIRPEPARVMVTQVPASGNPSEQVSSSGLEAREEPKDKKPKGTASEESSKASVAVQPKAEPSELPTKKGGEQVAQKGSTLADQHKPAPRKSSKELSLTGEHTLVDIVITHTSDRVTIRVTANDPFPTKSFTLSAPDRFVVDLPGKWKGMKVPTVPSNKTLARVRLGNQSTGPRLVFDLLRPVRNATIERSGDNFIDIHLY